MQDLILVIGLITAITIMVTKIVELIIVLLKRDAENNAATNNQNAISRPKSIASILFSGFLILSGISSLLFYLWLYPEKPPTTKDVAACIIFSLNALMGFFFLRTDKLH